MGKFAASFLVAWALLTASNVLAEPPGAPSVASEVQLARLERLAAHLESVPPSAYDKSRWVTRGEPGSPDYIACSGGHAASIAEFRDAGLRMHPGSLASAATPTPSYGDKEGDRALGAFFGIEPQEAARLFGATPAEGRPHDPAAEARAIRRVIASHRDRAFAAAAPGWASAPPSFVAANP